MAKSARTMKTYSAILTEGENILACVKKQVEISSKYPSWKARPSIIQFNDDPSRIQKLSLSNGRFILDFDGHPSPLLIELCNADVVICNRHPDQFPNITCTGNSSHLLSVFNSKQVKAEMIREADNANFLVDLFMNIKFKLTRCKHSL